jgi:hypothetical protein
VKTKKLVRLKHQFLSIAGDLSPAEIADALAEAGLISLCDDGQRYFENDKMRAIPRHGFDGTVKLILSSYQLKLRRGQNE